MFPSQVLTLSPGTTLNFSLDGTSINFDFINISINSRQCELGEIYLTNLEKCFTCKEGTYSMNKLDFQCQVCSSRATCPK